MGGGTILPAQSSCLEMLGVKGPHPTNPGQNASTLARYNLHYNIIFTIFFTISSDWCAPRCWPGS